MLSKFRSLWQKAKKPLEITVVSTFVVGLIILIILVILGTIFQWTWTGFGPETSAPIQHAKTLWDWLQLLIIPVVLAIGGYAFTLTTSRNEQQSTQLRDQTERDIASDNQRETVIQAYVDKMSELLLDRKLRESVEDDEVRKIARVRTLTILPRLDDVRKKSILQFLYESGLIKKDKCILDLTGANLSGADLRLADLREADLREADLSGADLSGADLSGADLSGADLRGARLREADLSGASFSGARLSRANLSGANLSGADLLGARLSRANLSGANLLGANLMGAKLSLANLSGANLSGANLRGVDLSGAKIDQSSLNKANVTEEQHATLKIIAP